MFFVFSIYSMSLAVLKKKAGTKYGKLSSNSKNGFSLNNPRRIRSHSNQVQTQTPMKGNVPRGHGSCCGKYPIRINKSQYVNYDFHERQYNGDKSNQGISVKNHNGSMAVRHKWLKRGYPHYIVKNMEPLDYATYISKLNAQSSSQNYASSDKALLQDSCESSTLCRKKASVIVKDATTMSQGEYLQTKLLQKNCLPTPNSKLHYPIPQSGQCSSLIDTTGTGASATAPAQSFGVICE